MFPRPAAAHPTVDLFSTIHDRLEMPNPVSTVEEVSCLQEENININFRFMAKLQRLQLPYFQY